MSELILSFDGFWREINKHWITVCPGVYCVYACTYRPEIGKVHLNRLLYIGQSEDVNARIAGHERSVDWMSSLTAEQQLCYAVAEVGNEDARNIAEAALIFRCKPPFNVEGKDRFPYPAVHVAISGCNGLLPSEFCI